MFQVSQAGVAKIVSTAVQNCGVEGVHDAIFEYIASVLLSLDHSNESIGVTFEKIAAPILMSWGACTSPLEARGVCTHILRATKAKLEPLASAQRSRSLRLGTSISVAATSEAAKQRRLKWVRAQSSRDIWGQKVAAEARAIERRQAARRERKALCGKLNTGVGVPQVAEAAIGATGKATDEMIEIHGIDIAFGGNALIRDSSLRMIRGRRYGLIGRNGTGKTTLMSAIANNEFPLPPNCRVHYLRQEVPSDGRRVLDVVLAADAQRQRLVDREQELLKISAALIAAAAGASERPPEFDIALAFPDEAPGFRPTVDDCDAEIDAVYEELNEIGAFDAEARAAKILAGLQFTPHMQQRATRELSGGWRMRVALAATLFARPTLLLLDEPDNHLDLHAIIWLEEHLRSLVGTTVLIVSHDADLLNNVCTDIILLAGATLHQYRGDYDTFVAAHSARMKHRERENERITNERERIQHFVDRFRANAKRASLVQSRIKALARLADVQPVFTEKAFKLSFPTPEPLPGVVLELVDVSFAYTQNLAAADFRLEGVSMQITMDSKIALVGPNGAGKSTALGLLAGTLRPLLGHVQRAGRLRVATFRQHHTEAFDRFATPLSIIASRFPGEKEGEYRTHLARFGLDAEIAARPVHTMSGGQRSRLAFALLSFNNKPHVLLLDEPGNHLDIETRRELALLISEFEGAVILVSHDAQLIRCSCDELWVVEGAHVRRFEGDFDAYRGRLRTTQ